MPGSTLHVVTSTARRGAEVFAAELVTALAARGRPGRLVALSPGAGPTRLAVPVLGAGSTRSPSTLWALRREVAASGVVVAHGSDTLAACAAACVDHRPGFVYRVIGDPAYWSPAGWRHHRVALLLRRATAVVTFDADSVYRLMSGYGIARARLHVIPNGVDPERFPLATGDDRAAARTSLGLPADAPVVAYVGALSAEKDPLAAVEAVLALDGVHLVVAGDGPLRSRLPAVERVHVLGAVPDVRPVYAAADVLVLPSATEGMPAAVIEAGMTGLPIVAARVGSVGQILMDGHDGHLVPAGDGRQLEAALRRVLDDPESFGGPETRIRFVARFGLPTVAAAWDDLLRTIEPA